VSKLSARSWSYQVSPYRMESRGFASGGRGALAGPRKCYFTTFRGVRRAMRRTVARLMLVKSSLSTGRQYPAERSAGHVLAALVLLVVVSPKAHGGPPLPPPLQLRLRVAGFPCLLGCVLLTESCC
jgi:hypothetical protein